LSFKYFNKVKIHGKNICESKNFQWIQTSGEIGGSEESQWWFSSTHSQYLHHMKVSGQVQALASVPWGKKTIFPSSRRLDGPHGRSEILGRSNVF
jgi:hypothetical protein